MFDNNFNGMKPNIHNKAHARVVRLISEGAQKEAEEGARLWLSQLDEEEKQVASEGNILS